MHTQRLASSILFCGVSLAGAEWPPIPGSAWAVKEDPAKGIQGGVVIEDRISFRKKEFERFKRIRILSQAGRNALDLEPYDPKAGSLEFRVVQPDGTETRFDPARDSVEKQVVIGGITHAYRSPVLSGVSNDCIVDWRWREPLTGDALIMPARFGLSHEWRLSNQFPTSAFMIEIAKDLKGHHALLGTELGRPEAHGDAETFRFVFRSVPAEEAVPFGLASQMPGPRLAVWYPLPESLSEGRTGKGPLDWSLLAGALQKYYELDARGNPVKQGRSFNAFAEAVLKEAPRARHDRAIHVLKFLESNILNTSYPTRQERLNRPKSVVEEEADPADLEGAVQRGRTNGHGMAYLFYHLMKRAGVQPTLLLVADRQARLFDPGRPDPYQLDTAIIGIRSERGELLPVHPSKRFFPTGLIEAEYQGTKGLYINPYNAQAQVIEIPFQEPITNRSTYAYTVSVGEETDSFSFKAGFLGLPEYRLRSACLGMEDGGQPAFLREELQAQTRSGGYVLSEARIENAGSARQDLEWRVSGTVEREEGRHRTVHPFPGLPLPLQAPARWPETRTQPIVLPYRMVFSASSRIEVPEGRQLRSVDPIDARNSVGTVQWSLKALEGTSGRVWAVSYTVTITQAMLGREEYGALKTFLSWVNEGKNRLLILEKR